MTLLLLGVCVSGLVASKLLFELGMRSMLARYLLAVCVSYAVFFCFMRIWLWYVGASPKDDQSHSTLEVVDALDTGQLSIGVGPEGTGIGDNTSVAFSGRGGDFGGGGATDMWGDEPTTSVAVHSSVGTSGHRGSSGKSGGWGFDFDLGDEGIVLIALGLLVLVIFGAGAYLIYAAPEILTEAALEAVLAAGLIKASRKITRQGWMGSVLRATYVPFLVVLVMTAVFGVVAQRYYPNATRLADIFKQSSPAKR